MRTKFKNLIKTVLIICSSVCFFSCDEYIPFEELDGHILTDSDGKRYKLEWQGLSESWRFLEEVKSKTDSTKKIWIYVSERTFYK